MATQQRNHAAIPQEILFDILLWLPATSLAQFRCVCTEWNSIISSGFFIKKHAENVNKNLTLGNNHRLILSCSGSLHSIKFENESNLTVKQLKLPPNNYAINRLKGVASCNGILCFYFWNDEILLWNPCNREYKNLPLPRHNFYEKEFSNITNAFGFGYDHSMDDYKVVRLYSVKREGELKRHRCQVYSLRTNSWKKIYFPYWNVKLDFETPVTGTLVNSILYWSVRILDDYDDGILCFDLVKDQYVLLSLSFIRGKKLVLGNFEGRLCLFRRCYLEKCVDIWALNIKFSNQDGRKSNDHWTHLMTVSFPEEGTSLSKFVSVCSMTNGGQFLLINSGKVSLHLLNIEEKAFKKFHIGGYYRYATQAIAYTETLTSLYRNGGKKRFLNKEKSRKLNKRRKKTKKGYKVEA